MPQIQLSDYVGCLVAVRGSDAIGFLDYVQDGDARVIFLPGASYNWYPQRDITILVHCRDMIALAEQVREAHHG